MTPMTVRDLCRGLDVTAADQEQRNQHWADDIRGPGCNYCRGTGMVGYWPCRKCTPTNKA